MFLHPKGWPDLQHQLSHHRQNPIHHGHHPMTFNMLKRPSNITYFRMARIFKLKTKPRRKPSEKRPVFDAGKHRWWFEVFSPYQGKSGIELLWDALWLAGDFFTHAHKKCKVADWGTKEGLTYKKNISHWLSIGWCQRKILLGLPCVICHLQ